MKRLLLISLVLVAFSYCSNVKNTTNIETKKVMANESVSYKKDTSVTKTKVITVKRKESNTKTSLERKFNKKMRIDNKSPNQDKIDSVKQIKNREKRRLRNDTL